MVRSCFPRIFANLDLLLQRMPTTSRLLKLQHSNFYTKLYVYNFSRTFETLNVSHVQLLGVGDAHDKHKSDNETEPKGVKAHFKMDDSGILNLESVSLKILPRVKIVGNRFASKNCIPLIVLFIC